MKDIFKNYKITLVAIAFLFPFQIFAKLDNRVCSPFGYSVLTINGIFTDEDEAKENKEELKKLLPPTLNSESLTIDYLHNPSHLGGIGDVAKVVYQKIFDNETVEDYDLIEMLKSASEKVKTQKILLVAHSQGNFYANSFYDIVSGKQGGVPAESIGVYSVATPASRVAGGGKWLTSDTDKIIADLVGRMPFKKIMPPNTSIKLSDSDDDSNGHNFSGVYLKYRGKEIVSDIKNSLDKLKIDNAKNPQVSCIETPKLTLAHKITGTVFAVADPVAETGIVAVVFAGNVSATAVKTVAQVAVTTASSITATAKSLVNEMANLAGNNSATVNVATQKTKIPSTNSVVANKQNVSVPAITTNQKTIEKSSVLSTVINTASASEPSEKLIAMPEKGPPPKLVFVGLRTLKGGASSQVTPQKVEDVEIEPETEDELSAPTLSITQCDYSLASDGCLLATTTINFSWTAVSGADYYAINKNGEYSTTTELFFDAIVADFSDYTFSISAISSATTSATSTQTISVATIPIAINEIAWMGTQASSFDEWLELKNNTGHTIDLSQWVLGSQDDAPYIILSGSIAPHEYRILERRENTIVVNSEVLVYGNGSSQWALGNNGEELTLSYSSTTLDKTPAIIGGVWTAGDSSATTSRKTMERIDSKQSGATTTSWATWGTNVNFIKIGKDADGNQILGTPGECNSASFININGGQDIASSTTLGADNCYYISAGVSVSASSTLTIEEGARISLYQNNLYIDGVLDVNGEENNPVIFDSFSGSPTTNKIQISGNSGTSTINNAVISDTGGVSLNSGADVEVVDTNFTSNEYGIQLYSGSSAVIENVNFASTTREAISAYSGSIIEVASSTITNTIDAEAIGVYESNLSVSSTTIDMVYDGDGIGVYDSTVSLASSTISNVLSGDGIGVYDSTVSLENSTISNILSGDGVGAYDSTTTMENVVVENTSGDGIAVYSGSISGNATIDGVEVEY